MVASASVRLRPPALFAGPSVFARGEDFAGFAGLAGSVFALLFAGIGLLLVAVALFLEVLAALALSRQGITERAERDDAARDEGERTCYHIATSTDHRTISSANP